MTSSSPSASRLPLPWLAWVCLAALGIAAALMSARLWPDWRQNPDLSHGLLMPAVFLVLRRIAGAVWAKVGVILYLAAPMLMVAAATELAHTSCLLALAWMTWCLLRARDTDAQRQAEDDR